MKKLLLLAMGCALSVGVHAVNLGIQGKTWDVGERDIREIIAEQIAKADWDSVQDELVESAKSHTANLMPNELPAASETRTRWIDPSITVKEDVYAPIEQEDGSYAWEVIVPAGSKVNPLSHVTPIDNMLFFDGRDPEQVKFALDAQRNHIYDLVLVMTAGDPGALSDHIQRPVYYANTLLMDRFGIERTPSLLGIGEGEYALYLAVTEFASPYSQERLEAGWHGLPDTKEGVK